MVKSNDVLPATSKFSVVFQQTRCLFFRNLQIKMRMKGSTFQEIFWPHYFVLLILAAKIFTPEQSYDPKDKTFTAYSPFDGIDMNNSLIYYTPLQPNYIRIMDLFKKLSLFDNVTIQGFSNTNSMESKYDHHHAYDNKRKIFGIEFSSQTSYNIRLASSVLPWENEWDYMPGNCRTTDVCHSRKYRESGLSALQIAIDTAIMQSLEANYRPPNISIAEMPKDAFTPQKNVVLPFLAAFYLTLSMSFFSVFILSYIVYEKEKKLAEGMKTMGMKSIAYWLSWIMTAFLSVTIITLSMSVILKVSGIYGKSSFLLLFLLLFLQGCSIEMLSFMITPFFNKASSAAFFGGLLSFCSSFVFLIVVMNDDLSTLTVWAISSLSPAAFALGIYQLTNLEQSDEGATFSNIYDGDYPLIIPLVMIPVDMVVYGILTLYLDKVVPGAYGVKHKPWFFLLPSYWFPKHYNISMNVNMQYPQNAAVESVPDFFKDKETIRFQNLTKTFKPFCLSLKKDKRTTKAVNNFSLSVYEGQITALLGHNGAGKTTIFNILTGFSSPTEGNVMVYGYDLSNPVNIDIVRSMIGICPQYNLQFDIFTVEENLMLFAGIKLLSYRKAKSDIAALSKVVGMDDELHTRASKLSGGQKRKLSVMIALLGDPKIVVLDEPTAGMDPTSRRKLWKLLRSRMENKVILLSTHFMDEADILADRKAIISKGELTCVGSSLYLKNKFGIGYHLGVVTEGSGHDKISDVVEKHIPLMGISRETSHEIEFTLPLSDVESFAGLFADIESRQKELGIKTFSVSMTTLEEVFLKIGKEEMEEEQLQNERERENAFMEHTIGKRVVRDTSLAIVFNDQFHQNSITGDREHKSDTFGLYRSMLHKQLLLKIRTPGYLFTGLAFSLGMAAGSIAILPKGNSVSGERPSIINLSYGGPYNWESIQLVNETGNSLDYFAAAPIYPPPQIMDNISQVFIATPPAALSVELFEFKPLQVDYRLFYNSSYVHSIPVLINWMSRYSLFNLVYPNSSFVPIKITRQYWPSLNIGPSVFDGSLFGGALMACLSLVIGGCICIQHPVQEREKKIRSQLRISGVTYSAYWFSLLTIDVGMYYLTGMVLVIGMVWFDVQGVNNPFAMACLVVIVIGYGPSLILATYCLSFIYNKAGTAESTGVMLVEIVCFIPFSAVSTLGMVGYQQLADIIGIFFSLLNPFYTGFDGIYGLFSLYNEYKQRGQSHEIPLKAYLDFSHPSVPMAMILVYVHSFLLYYVLKAIEIKHSGGSIKDAFPLLRAVKRRVSSTHLYDPASTESFRSIDSDVQEEDNLVQNKITNLHRKNEDKPLVLVSKLRKKFVKNRRGKDGCKSAKTEKLVVRDVSLSVSPGQVLGLLGPNGAGKTTTINIITAETSADTGDVYICGNHIKSNTSQAYKKMGYCPQDNPIWDQLTLYEHLYIYSVARGVPRIKRKMMVKCFLDALDIQEHANKRGKNLSGGTQRKLCFAISMLNNPPVVLLDEPSSGQDPKTKRFMWNAISKAFDNSSRGAILTTHYMDEADALCNKVGIMVKGKLNFL